MRAFFSFVLFILLTNSYGQGTVHLFEQNALDYFGTEILDKKEPFVNFKASFNGVVDSSLSIIVFPSDKMRANNPNLVEHSNMILDSDGYNWRDDLKKPFKLQVNPPIKNARSKKSYGQKSKIVRLKVFQNRLIGDKNYVWIRTFFGSGDQGQDVFIEMGLDGQVIEWYYEGFIF